MAGSGSGVTIVEIADVSRMRVEVDVDETDVSKIVLGQEVDVTVDACPDEHFPGKVIKIAPKAEVNSNVTTVPVTVELAHTDARLKPEMNATCDFVVGRRDNVLFVPVEAITDTDNGPQVMVLQNGKPTPCSVQVGLEGDDYCEITRGLADGERVIIATEAPTNSSGPGGPGGGPGGPGGPPPPM
jgi:RND family efflux transporter MFP subunit